MTLSRASAQTAAAVFLATGLIALAYVAYVVVDARAYQAAAHRQLVSASRHGPAPRDQSLPRAPVEGEPLGEIQLTRRGPGAVIAEGVSPGTLSRAVGHVIGTARPGEAGNVVLAGHRDTFFRPLRHVRVGDIIDVRTPAAGFSYEVESTSIVSPSHIEVLEASGGHTLTLITCYPFTYVGPAPDRFIVRARERSGRPEPTASR